MSPSPERARQAGWQGKGLWELQKAGKLAIRELTPDETSRMRELMEQYQDAPMDLADASLVAVAESSSLRSVFTNDRDFEGGLSGSSP